MKYISIDNNRERVTVRVNDIIAVRVWKQTEENAWLDIRVSGQIYSLSMGLETAFKIYDEILNVLDGVVK